MDKETERRQELNSILSRCITEREAIISLVATFGHEPQRIRTVSYRMLYINSVACRRRKSAGLHAVQILTGRVW